MEPDRNRPLIAGHFSTYTDRNPRLLSSHNSLTNHSQYRWMVRMIHVCYFLVHPVYSQHILYKVVCSDTEEINLPGKQISDCRSSRNLYHDANLYVLTIRNASFTKLTFCIFKYLVRLTNFLQRGNHRVHDLYITMSTSPKDGA
ncbi:hypothetical protein D3C78_1183190 [compost metagenome]